MIADTLDRLTAYLGLHPHLDSAILTLQTLGLADLPDGTVELPSRNLRCSLMTVPLGGKAHWEAHRNWIDLQLVLEHEETIAWAPLEAIDGWSGYDPVKDIMLSDDKNPGSPVRLQKGMFAVFFPEDAHRPGIGQGQSRKAVFKIKVQADEAPYFSRLNHMGTKLLRGPRLTLRRYTPEDAQDMYDNWCSDPKVTAFLTWETHPDAAFTRRLLSGWVADYGKPNTYQWGIEFNGQLLGDIAVVGMNEETQSCEIGYCLSSAYWGRGIMTEALELVMNFLFREVRFERITLRHFPDNPASGRVMQKAGLAFEGILRRTVRHKDGQLTDVALYAALKDEWLKAHRDFHH